MIKIINLRRFYYSIEIFLSLCLAVYFGTKIFNVLYSNNYYPRITFNDGTIYLKGRLHIPEDGFLNLVAFDYADFIRNYPYWNKVVFSQILSSHSLIVTHYNLREFTDLLLRLNFPYWQKGSVKIFIKSRDKWVPLNDIINFTKTYSLEDVLFLGLGMEGMSFKGISEADFIRAYFKNKKIGPKKDVINKLLYNTEALVKISLDEKN